MKTLKIAITALALVTFTLNASYAKPPEKKQLRKEYRKVTRLLVNKLHKHNFLRYVDETKVETLDVYVQINESNEVELKKVVGSNEDLNALAAEIIESENYTAKAGLCGKQMAVRLQFKKD